MGSVMRRLGRYLLAVDPWSGKCMVSVSVFLRALVGEDTGLPAKSLAPGIRTDTDRQQSSSRGERELWLNFRTRISLFQVIMLIFEAGAVTWRTSITCRLLPLIYVWCDYWYYCSFPARPWFHHRGNAAEDRRCIIVTLTLVKKKRPLQEN